MSRAHELLGQTLERLGVEEGQAQAQGQAQGQEHMEPQLELKFAGEQERWNCAGARRSNSSAGFPGNRLSNWKIEGRLEFQWLEKQQQPDGLAESVQELEAAAAPPLGGSSWAEEQGFVAAEAAAAPPLGGSSWAEGQGLVAASKLQRKSEQKQWPFETQSLVGLEVGLGRRASRRKWSRQMKPLLLKRCWYKCERGLFSWCNCRISHGMSSIISHAHAPTAAPPQPSQPQQQQQQQQQRRRRRRRHLIQTQAHCSRR